MSSAFTTTAPITSTVSFDEPTFTTPPASDGGDDGAGSMNRGANYFFGFLITFVVLLLIFVGCGILSRRRLMVRRQAALLETWGAGDGDGLLKVPTMLEKPIVTSEPDWMFLMPLTARLLCGPQLILRGDDPITSTEPRVEDPGPHLDASEHPRHGRSSLNLPSWIHEESKKLSLRHREKPLPVEAIEVAVMITMPSEMQLPHVPEHASDDDTQQLPEYQLGVATMPWCTEIQPPRQ
ncbi:hypothetical protein BJ165DRAFT_1524405 [Panaeolus papilionaceus]|nr:hypothetical protein BJ165DRAFT_1524405 [Panaeolus papilionaceus]